MRRHIPLVLVLAAVFAVTSAPAAGGTGSAGPLTGTWSGTLYGAAGVKQHIVIVVNGTESAGSWKMSATCDGPLTLQSISSGYHHYLRHVKKGSTCRGGDVDCLKPAAAGVYDSVSSHLGGAWDMSGTLRRVAA